MQDSISELNVQLVLRDYEMTSYYVNKNQQANGDHEVHTDSCRFLPLTQNRVSLGNFTTCAPAVQEAKRLGYSRANGCRTCSIACHTS